MCAQGCPQQAGSSRVGLLCHTLPARALGAGGVVDTAEKRFPKQGQGTTEAKCSWAGPA